MENIVIREVERISSHAVDRMVERVIPWANNWNPGDVKKLIRLLTENRVHTIVRKNSGGKLLLESHYLRFVYTLRNKQVRTILPYRQLSPEDVLRLEKYHGKRLCSN